MNFLERAVGALNRMVSDGVVSGYVIGGAMGAMFYTEPFETHDLDIFVAFPTETPIVTLEPVYEYLKAKGYGFQDEHVIVEGVPVQVLPVVGPLVEEAAREAVLKKVGDQDVRVMGAEHLIAIMASLSRPKDRIRIPMVLSQAPVDREKLKDIIARHGLAAKLGRIAHESQ